MQLVSAAHRLWRRWQVELHGQYSLDRMRQVKLYAMRVSATRLCLLCVFTPLPCIFISFVLDTIHVEAVSAGAAHSPKLWLRCVAALWLFTVFLLLQQRQLMPQLALSRRILIAVATLSSISCVGTLFGLALTIGYPVPFSGAGGLVVWLVFLLFFLALGSRLGAWFDPHTQAMDLCDLRQCAVLLLSQMAPTCIYTLFNAGYEAVATPYQPVFICLLPVLKVATKNAISFSLRDIDDLKPEVVIFNVEIFHALFVACSMQTASTSLVNVFALFFVGVFQSGSALLELHAIVEELKPLQAKLGEEMQNGIPVAVAELLALARMIAETDRSIRSSHSLRASTWRAQFLSRRRRTSVTPTALAGPPSQLTATSVESLRTSSVQSLQPVLVRGASAPTALQIPIAPTLSPSPDFTTSPVQIMPLPAASRLASRPTLARIKSGSTLSVPRRESSQSDQLIAAFKSLHADDRILLVQKTLQILYVTEFVALVEYTEVIMPLIYVLCLLMSFYGPNRDSFQFLHFLDGSKLESTVQFVLLYALMEFMSLLVMTTVVWRKLGVPLLHQLAFVLDTQWINVQSKLIVWVVYVVQTSLVQLGADYSFQFSWLRHSHP